LTPYLALELPFGYFLKQVSGSNLRGNVKVKYTFHYWQLTPQRHILPGSDRQFFIVFGAYVGYITGAQEQHTFIQNASYNKQIPKDITEDPTLNHWDAGIVIGLGYEFQSGLIFKCIGNTGLLNVADIAPDASNKWVCVELSLGYNFGKLLE